MFLGLWGMMCPLLEYQSNILPCLSPCQPCQYLLIVKDQAPTQASWLLKTFLHLPIHTSYPIIHILFWDTIFHRFYSGIYHRVLEVLLSTLLFFMHILFRFRFLEPYTQLTNPVALDTLYNPHQLQRPTLQIVMRSKQDTYSTMPGTV